MHICFRLSRESAIFRRTTGIIYLNVIVPAIMAKLSDVQIMAWIRFEGKSGVDGLYLSYRDSFAVPVDSVTKLRALPVRRPWAAL